MNASSSGGPCQVDFYVLQDPRKSVEQLACQLAMMAWEQGMRCLLVVPDQHQAGRLDELMWSVPNGRFLPHQVSDESLNGSLRAPITIGSMAILDQAAVDVVINLDMHAVPGPQRFRRLLELVPARDADREASRNKFRAYREVGLAPVSHNMA
jgi:DNA polymerase-3 subunit chi